MSVTIPNTPLPRSWPVRLVQSGQDGDSPVGGNTQRIVRLGDKIAIDATFLDIEYEPWGRQWRSRLAQASNSTAIWSLPAPKGGFINPGSTLVDGGDQLGMTLDIKGGTHGFVLPEGVPFNIVEDGWHYLHFLAADATIGSDGKAALSIWPAMRVVPSDGATIDFHTPKIEGFCPRNPTWPLDDDDVMSIALTIIEAR